MTRLEQFLHDETGALRLGLFLGLTPGSELGSPLDDMLLETGEYLLLETGDFLRLE